MRSFRSSYLLIIRCTYLDRYANTREDTLKPYKIYGIAIAEVEIDLLTGQHIVKRVDLVEDAGMSLNPEIDVGQVEGAFVMGMGYWTSEELVYDPKTGALTNYRTWVCDLYLEREFGNASNISQTRFIES